MWESELDACLSVSRVHKHSAAGPCSHRKTKALPRQKSTEDWLSTPRTPTPSPPTSPWLLVSVRALTVVIDVDGKSSRVPVSAKRFFRLSKSAAGGSGVENGGGGAVTGLGNNSFSCSVGYRASFESVPTRTPSDELPSDRAIGTKERTAVNGEGAGRPPRPTPPAHVARRWGRYPI